MFSLGMSLVVVAIATGEAPAVLVSAPDDAASRVPPGGGFPWRHVGQHGDFSAVYLGNRWVLTAGHVGIGPVRFASATYRPLLRSVQPLRNPDGTASDLRAFRIDGDPSLPLLRISRDRPPPGQEVILVGNGRDRGPPMSWQPDGGELFRGWRTAEGRRMRWGTNRLDAGREEISVRGIRTRILSMRFSPPELEESTPLEGQAVHGDSGGALVIRRDGRFVLAGIIIVRADYPGQPPDTALYGNRTYAADLSVYRGQLIALTRPDCADERDNDDDGAIDYPADSGCPSGEHDSERAQSNGEGPTLQPWSAAPSGTSVTTSRSPRSTRWGGQMSPRRSQESDATPSTCVHSSPGWGWTPPS